MIESLQSIPQVGNYLKEKFKKIDFISSYTPDMGISIFENKIEAQINFHAFKFYCLHSLGASGISDNDEIILDYGIDGVLAFYQLMPGTWLIIAASRKLFPLVNLEIKKIDRKKIKFNLNEDIVSELPPIEEENIIQKKESESVKEKYLAAQRLQQSILPDLSILGKYFNNHFSYYSPEDILSGDFYWLKDTEDSIYIVIADCTGHSIEGALATMTVNTILNQRVEKDPENSLRLVYEDLKKFKSSKQDEYSIGVEMAICRYDKKSGDIHIATSGVLVLFIENEDTYSLLKIKGNQNPNAEDIKIESIRLNANKGDKIILYSDGLPDQFDKNDKKKLGNTGIRKMFVGMNGSFSAQQFEFDFDKWKGKTKQLDDITVLALEV